MKTLVDDVHVAIPWMGDDIHRRAALGWVARRWVDAGCPPTLGLPNGDVWVKAQAVCNAIGDSTAPILVVADADCWSDGVVEAIELVRRGVPWVVPATRLHRLTPDTTIEVLAGAEPHTGMPVMPLFDGGPTIVQNVLEGGGIVVLRRDVYEDCPLDPRFQGWGQEDEAWAISLRCLHGPAQRLSPPMFHLWHPPQQRKTRGVGSDQGMALYKRYARVHRHPDRMRALIAEGREAADAHPSRDRRDAHDLSVSAT